MKVITVRLTDEEYTALKERAEKEHRSVGQQARHLVVQAESSIAVRTLFAPSVGGTIPYGPLTRPRVRGESIS